MRVIVIATGRDPGNPITGGPTPDGPWPVTPMTRLDISPPLALGGHLRFDVVDLGEITAIVVDHEDERPPAPDAY